MFLRFLQVSMRVGSACLKARLPKSSLKAWTRPRRVLMLQRLADWRYFRVSGIGTLYYFSMPGTEEFVTSLNIEDDETDSNCRLSSSK